jgi:hypothetical protein
MYQSFLSLKPVIQAGGRNAEQKESARVLLCPVTVAPAATVAVPARGDCLYPTYETIAT